jgi:hypothetical protein
VSELRRRVETGFDRFLFASADPLSVGIFRVILGATLAVNFRKIGDVTPPIEASARLYSLYHSVLLTLPYHALCMLLIGSFAVGVGPRSIGFILTGLLAPLDFVSLGQQSRQLLLFSSAAGLCGTASAGSRPE